MKDLSIVAGGRELPDALDRIRRYCGLPWSGGPPETWAWHYYDAVPTAHDDDLTPTDVLCVASLHPGLSRADLAFFRERRNEISTWLAKVPTGVRLWEATDAVVEHLTGLPDRFPEISVTLLSKVLHRKRPHLVPLLDRHAVDWYRPVTGKRVMVEAWAPIVRAMRDDELDDERRLLHSIAFGGIENELWPLTDIDDRPRLSWIRAIDIAIWMGSR
jgi:hypothetical protein